MTAKFDVKVQANSLSKLMALADSSITKPGGAIATERLIDYATDEFNRMTPVQSLEVLAAIDENYQKKLLKDGHGEIIGYMYSRKIFVSMRRPDGSPVENPFVNKHRKGRA